MTIVILILCIFILSSMGYKTYREVESRKTYGIALKQANHVSWPGRQVLKAYYELPKDNRPEANVPAIIKALDVKYGVVEATEHFEHQERNYHGSGPAFNREYAWKHCRCSTVYNRGRGGYVKNCSFPEYRELVVSIDEIQTAITAQRRALEISSVDGDLENAKALTERLREERDLIKKATSEL